MEAQKTEIDVRYLKRDIKLLKTKEPKTELCKIPNYGKLEHAKQVIAKLERYFTKEEIQTHRTDGTVPAPQKKGSETTKTNTKTKATSKKKGRPKRTSQKSTGETPETKSYN